MTDETNTLATGQNDAATGAGAQDQDRNAQGTALLDQDQQSTDATQDNDGAGNENLVETDEDLIGGEEATYDPFEGYEDLEHEGQKYKVPAALKEGWLRQADYTRKTQAVAEKERVIQAREAELQQRFQTSDQEFQAKMTAAMVESSLEEFKDVNWQKEFSSVSASDDPVAAIELQQKYARYQHLMGIHGQAQQVLQQAAQQRTQAAEQDIANRLRATADYAKREIKGWTPEVDVKVAQFARNQGFSQQELEAAMSPRIYKILHLARIGEQTLSRQQTAKPATAPIAKTTTVTAKGSPQSQKSLEEMSPAEYAAYRSAQSGRK